MKSSAWRRLIATIAVCASHISPVQASTDLWLAGSETIDSQKITLKTSDTAFTRVRADFSPGPFIEFALVCDPDCVGPDAAPYETSKQFQTGLRLLGEKDYLGAADMFRSALAVGPPHASLYRNLAMALLGQGDLRLALSTVNKAFELHNYPSRSLQARARIYFAMDEYEAALRDFEGAMAIDGENAATLNRLAYVFAELGRFEEALKSAWKAYHMVPPARSVWRADIQDTIGDVHCLSGRPDNAKEAYHASWRTLLRQRDRKFKELEVLGYLDGSGAGLFKRPPDIALSNWIADGCPGVLKGNQSK